MSEKARKTTCEEEVNFFWQEWIDPEILYLLSSQKIDWMQRKFPYWPAYSFVLAFVTMA